MSEPSAATAGPDANRATQVTNAGWYLLPTLIGNVIPIVTLPILTRLLSPADYGALGLATAYAVFTTSLANFGLTVSYERNFFQYREGSEPAALLYSVLGFVTGAYALCVIVTWLFAPQIAAAIVGDSTAASLVMWTTAANGLSSLKWYYLTYLRNTGQARAYVWFTIDETLLTNAGALLLIGVFSTGVIGLPMAQCLSAATVFIMVSVRISRTLRPAFRRDLLYASLKLGYPLTPRVLSGAFVTNFDKLMLGSLTDTATVGLYALGQRVAHLAFAYSTALENVFAPRVYDHMFKLGQAGGAAIGRYLTPFAYLSMGIAVLICLFSEEGLRLIAPPEYAAAMTTINLLAVYYAFMFFGKQPQLYYAKKSHIVSTLTFVNMAVNCVIVVTAIRVFGPTGAAIGTLLGGCSALLVSNIVAARYYRIEWEYGKLAIIASALLACALLTLAMQEAGLAYPARLALKVGLLAVYCGVGVGLRIITRDNVTLIMTVVRSKFGPRPSVTPA